MMNFYYAEIMERVSLQFKDKRDFYLSGPILKILKICVQSIVSFTFQLFFMAKLNETQPVTDLPPELSQPALRALYGAGFYSLKQLSTLKEADLAKLHGVGPNAIAKLKQAMSAKGLAFAG